MFKFNLIYFLVINSFTSKYKGTILGYAWYFIIPLTMIMILSVIFSNVLSKSFFDYFIFISPAFFLWFLFSASIISSFSVLTEWGSVINKFNISKINFLIHLVLVKVIEFLIVFIPYLVFYYYFNFDQLRFLLFFIPLLLLFLIFIFGLILIFSIISLYFKDLKFIVPFIMQIIFFSSPIIYETPRFDNYFLNFIFNLNPLVEFFELSRMTLYHNESLLYSSYISPAIISLITLIFGLVIFKKNENLIVYYVR